MAHWKDFDPHLSIIRIGASSQTKTGRIRSVPLSSRAVEILNQQREFMASESGLIFHDVKGNALKGLTMYHVLGGCHSFFQCPIPGTIRLPMTMRTTINAIARTTSVFFFMRSLVEISVY